MKKNVPMFITKDVPIEPVIQKATETNSEIIHVKNQKNMASVILNYLEKHQIIKPKLPQIYFEEFKEESIICRFEKFQFEKSGNDVILDVAHNVPAMVILLQIFYKISYFNNRKTSAS